MIWAESDLNYCLSCKTMLGTCCQHHGHWDEQQPLKPLLSPSQPSLKCVCLYKYCHAAKLLSSVWLFATPWTAARQAPLSMGFSRQEYWNGLLCPSRASIPDSGIRPISLVSPALAGRFFTTSTAWESSKKGMLPPHWGIKPLTPAWQAGMVTTILTRTRHTWFLPRRTSVQWRGELGIERSGECRG